MHARLLGLTGRHLGSLAASLLVAALLAGCGAGSSTSTAGGASTAARSASQTTTTAPGAAHGEAATGANTDTTTASAPTPHGVKPEDRLGKTGFLAHSGLGFAAFHVYVSKPLRKHTFKHPGAAQRAALATGAVAATYAARELQVAATAATAEQRVAQLAAPLRTVSRRMRTIATAMKAGTVDAAAILAARREVNDISLTARRIGQPIQEVKPKLP